MWVDRLIWPSSFSVDASAERSATRPVPLRQATLCSPVKLSAIGFLGGYSTFSTWSFETLALGESGALLEAAVNVAGTFVVGLLVAAAGYALTSL